MKNTITIFLITLISISFVLFFLNTNFCYGKSDPQAPVTLPNPLGEDTTPQTLIGKIINAVLGIVGSLALVMFIYGGFTWMLAAGNQEKVQKGKDILIWATIGLIVIFSAYALVKFVFTGLGVT